MAWHTLLDVAQREHEAGEHVEAWRAADAAVAALIKERGLDAAQTISRLFRNALHKVDPPPYAKCARCGTAYNTRLPAGSRMAVERDVEICPLCGSLEAHRDAAGLPPAPPDEWPISPDELGREYAIYMAMIQRSELVEFTVDELAEPGDDNDQEEG